MQLPDQERQMLRVKEVAARLKVHPSTVYRWVKIGRLQAYRYGRLVTPGAPDSGPGGAIRIPESEVKGHLAA
nr:helix-turn-helix domain-containing protein [Streptomyces sp. NBRC 109706]